MVDTRHHDGGVQPGSGPSCPVTLFRSSCSDIRPRCCWGGWSKRESAERPREDTGAVISAQLLTWLHIISSSIWIRGPQSVVNRMLSTVPMTPQATRALRSPLGVCGARALAVPGPWLIAPAVPLAETPAPTTAGPGRRRRHCAHTRLCTLTPVSASIPARPRCCMDSMQRERRFDVFSLFPFASSCPDPALLVCTSEEHHVTCGCARTHSCEGSVHHLLLTKFQ